jgi:hypothetical protein
VLESPSALAAALTEIAKERLGEHRKDDMTVIAIDFSKRMLPSKRFLGFDDEASQ